MTVLYFYAFHSNFIDFCLVDAGTRAVIFDKFRGILPQSVGEGTHLKIPFIQVF
jgi:hypothetical protein